MDKLKKLVKELNLDKEKERNCYGEISVKFDGEGATKTVNIDAPYPIVALAVVEVIDMINEILKDKEIRTIVVKELFERWEG